MKYILLALGILLALFGDIIEKEKNDNFIRGFKFKKLTSFGWILFICSVVISVLGIIQTFNDEKLAKKQSDEKNLNDSISLCNKNKNDSLRFMSIIDKIANSQNAVLEKSNEIVTTTFKETDKILKDNKNNNFSIPDEFILNFDTELLIDEDVIKIKNDLRKHYTWNDSNLVGWGFKINYDLKNVFEYPILNAVHNFDNGVFIISLKFLDKNNKELLELRDINNGDLENGRTHKYKDPLGYQNNFLLTYFINESKINIYGNQIQIGTNKNTACKSLLELANKKIKVHIYSSSSVNANRMHIPLYIKLNNLTISTKGGIGTVVSKFKMVSPNNFESVLNDNIWK